ADTIRCGNEDRLLDGALALRCQDAEGFWNSAERSGRFPASDRWLVFLDSLSPSVQPQDPALAARSANEVTSSTQPAIGIASSLAVQTMPMTATRSVSCSSWAPWDRVHHRAVPEPSSGMRALTVVIPGERIPSTSRQSEHLLAVV